MQIKLFPNCSNDINITAPHYAAKLNVFKQKAKPEFCFYVMWNQISRKVFDDIFILYNIRFLEQHSMITSRLFVDSAHWRQLPHSVHRATTHGKHISCKSCKSTGTIANVCLDVNLHYLQQSRGPAQQSAIQGFRWHKGSNMHPCMWVQTGTAQVKTFLASLQGGPRWGQNSSSLILPQPSVGRSWRANRRSRSSMRPGR